MNERHRRLVITYRVEERYRGTEDWLPVYAASCLSESEIPAMLSRTMIPKECDYRVVKVTKVIQLISTEVVEIPNG